MSNNIYGQTPYLGAPYMSQQRMYQQQQQQAPAYIVQPVSSREEGLATRFEYGTLGTLMPDRVHGVVYFKCFNNDTGNVDFITLAPLQESAPPEYATTQDVAKMKDAINKLADEIEQLKRPGKAVRKNDAE